MMARALLGLVALLLWAPPAWAQGTVRSRTFDGAGNTINSTGGRLHVDVLTSDTVGTTTAMNAAGSRATVAVAGQWGITALIAAGTADGTLVARGSTDGGTTWTVECVFVSQGGQSTTSIGLTNPNDKEERAIFCAVPVTHASVEYSQYNSGTANATLRSMANNQNIVASGSDGSVLRVLATTSAGVLKVECQGGTCSGSGGTAQADNSAFTLGTSNLTPVGYLFASAPSAATDGRVAAARMNANRIAMALLTSTTGASLIDDALTSVRITPTTVVEGGGKAGSASVLPFVHATQQFNVLLTLANTPLEIIPVSAANQFPRLVHLYAEINEATGSGLFKVVEGDGANCATNKGTIWGPFRLDVAVLPARNWDGVLRPLVKSTNHTRAICVESDSATDVRVVGSGVTY